MAMSDYPIVPLPNPGEGAPVPTFPEVQLPEVQPVIPLPNPGEGGSIPTFPEEQLPQPQPVIPLPNPGEGGSIPTFPGGLLPGLIWPRTASVRFLNGARGYPGFRILVERNQKTRLLSYGALSRYHQIHAGYRTVTVMGPDGYVYIQKSLPFQEGTASTVAVVNRPGGLDLVQMGDGCCHPNGNFANIRMSNLAWQSRPMDMLLADGRTVYADVGFKETTAYKRIRPGAYEFLFADTDQQASPIPEDVETLDSAFIGMSPLPNMAASLYLRVEPHRNYTVFLLSGGRPGEIWAISTEN